MPAPIILASASPRRVELLSQLGLRCEVRPQHIDETRNESEAPTEFVQRLALEKARAANTGDESRPVLGADTVVCVDGDCLGKPDNAEHAWVMLQQLSGREHQVMTAVAMVFNGQQQALLSTSQVRFRSITQQEAASYWATGEPADKAGGYAIQGLGAIFVESIQGSYSGVMGLPLFETAHLLAAAGISVLGQ